jgi:hypothetical protein
VKNLKDKPFALIGFNVNPYDAMRLKAVMVKENLNWRSMASQGDVAAKWNSPGTPVYYLIDPAGVIRYKWVGNPGEKALGESLKKLIQEARTAAGNAPGP